jgi:DDE superfamily endonuclease
VFLEKLLGRKGICSKAYLEQVLEPIVFPLFDCLGLEYIFMEDGSKVYKGKVRLPRLEHGIRGFDWPPSSPDLNPIERVWWYMKEELKKLPYVVTTKAELSKEIQRIWDKIDPCDFHHYTERLTYIIEDVIKVKGSATIN